MKRLLPVVLVTCAVVAVTSGGLDAGGGAQEPAAGSPSEHRALLDRYCVTCHNARLQTAGLTLDTTNLASVDTGAMCGKR